MMAPMNRDLIRIAPALLFGVSAALLLGALAFQYIGGLQPCVLCIWQRYPHGAVLLLGALALGHALAGKPKAVPWLTMLAAVAMLTGAAIAAFHVGVEQGWWKGLEACAAGDKPPKTLEGAFEALKKGPVANCGDIVWQLFGISMAGYNFLISLVVGLFGLAATRKMVLQASS
jgi:disulfide bond formation protein DsbB